MFDITKPVTESINGSEVTVSFGDMTRIHCDAYIVPEFNDCASFGGVGGAVHRSGGGKGLEEYHKLAEKAGELPFGTVHLTPSYGGNSKYLLHAVTVGSPADQEYENVRGAVYAALKLAKAEGIQSVVAPSLGTGIIGQLTTQQSANAILSAVHQFTQEGGALKFQVVIFGDRDAFVGFADALKKKSFMDAPPQQIGDADFDPQRWVAGMNRDIRLNREFDGGDNH